MWTGQPVKWEWLLLLDMRQNLEDWVSGLSLNWLPQSTGLGGVGSRVVKSLNILWCKRSRVRIPVPPNVLGSDWIICKYLTLWVYPVFGMRACSLLRFVLIKLRHWGEPSAVPHAVYRAANDTRAKPCVMFGCIYLLCVLLYQCCPVWQMLVCCSVLTATIINEHYYYLACSTRCDIRISKHQPLLPSMICVIVYGSGNGHLPFSPLHLLLRAGSSTFFWRSKRLELPAST